MWDKMRWLSERALASLQWPTSSSYLATPMFSVVISIDFFLFVACFSTRLLLKPKESNESFVEEQIPRPEIRRV